MKIFEIVINLLFLAWGLHYVGYALINLYVYYKEQMRELELDEKERKRGNFID